MSDLISTIANDGVCVAPRIVAATLEPQSTPQTIAFHPVDERRVISSLTAARNEADDAGSRAARHRHESDAGRISVRRERPARRRKWIRRLHAYSRTKYVASFAGFAPINNPAIMVAVILDSAVGLHQGGQVSAPVFQRMAQQVLEYLHMPHDVELPASRQFSWPQSDR